MAFLRFSMALTLLVSINSIRAQCDDCDYEDTSVYCWGLGLVEVPTCLPENTTEIDLYFNSITSLEADSFATLPNLRIILIDSNEISSIAEDTFSGLPNLRSLSLSLNRISTLPSNLFVNNINLIYLDISFNDIETLDTRVLQPLTKLENFVAFDSSFTEITNDISFSFSPSLTFLDIGYNSLTTIDPSLFTSVTGLDLLLDGNPWNCDCATTNLLDVISQQNITISYDPSCATPEDLAGKLWSELGDLCNPTVINH